MTTTTRARDGETVGETIHVFERAGLGRAPFRCVGFYESKFQAVPGDPNCPIQPGTSCDFCGQGIMYVARIKDADGKEFKVGCDCVARTGDKGLRRIIDRKVAERRTAASKRNADAKIEAALAALPAVASKLAAKPHPRAYAGLSLLSWVEWMLSHAGRKGKVEAAKAILAEV